MFTSTTLTCPRFKVERVVSIGSRTITTAIEGEGDDMKAKDLAEALLVILRAQGEDIE